MKPINPSQHMINRFNERFHFALNPNMLSGIINEKRDIINLAHKNKRTKLYIDILGIPVVLIIYKSHTKIDLVTIYVNDVNPIGGKYVELISKFSNETFMTYEQKHRKIMNELRIFKDKYDKAEKAYIAPFTEYNAFAAALAKNMDGEYVGFDSKNELHLMIYEGYYLVFKAEEGFKFNVWYQTLAIEGESQSNFLLLLRYEQIKIISNIMKTINDNIPNHPEFKHENFKINGNTITMSWWHDALYQRGLEWKK